MVDWCNNDEKQRNRQRQIDLSLKKLDLDLKTRSNTKPSKWKPKKLTEKISGIATREENGK
jgi:hypothetical protein